MRGLVWILPWHRWGQSANSLDSTTSFMSQHRSLKGASTISAKRNVLKRFERVELLKKRGQFKDGDRVIGLRKTMPEA
jgi:small basic protein (TIGR04137 family)